MNFKKMYRTQFELDHRILKEKGLIGADLLAEKILALQVELGELANEWRGFKFWSEDKEPRTELSDGICRTCGGSGVPIGITDESGVDCWDCGGGGEKVKNPLLEEYVDCLHFILSVGIEIHVSSNNFIFSKQMPEKSVTDSFLSVFECISSLDITKDTVDWNMLSSKFLELGKMLDFSWEQIEQAYYDKNKVNHERQDNGY